MWPCLQGPVALFVFGSNDRQAIRHDNESVMEGVVGYMRLVSGRLLLLIRRQRRVSVESCPTLALPETLQEEAICNETKIY